MSVMNKHCEREQLFALAEHLLAGTEKRRVTEHVAECAECDAIVESYRKVDAALDTWRAAEPSAWFDARTRATLRAVEPARPPRRLWGFEWWRVVSPALAAMLVVVAGTVLLRSRLHPGSSVGKQIAPVQVTSTKTSAAAPSPEAQSAQQELKMYENLGVLEDYELLANIEGVPDAGNAANPAD